MVYGPLDEDGIADIFSFHPATEKTGPKHAAIREAFRDLALDMFEFLPESRERSLVFTKLQEAMMFANAAIAIHVKDDGEPLNKFSKE